MKVINQTKQKVYVSGELVLREYSLGKNIRKTTLSITSDLGNGIVKIQEDKVSFIRSYSEHLKIEESLDSSGETVIILS